MSKKSLADYTIESLFEADTDNSGSLSKEEIKKYFIATRQPGEKEISDTDVDAFIESVDLNNDQKITRSELTQMIYAYYGVS